MIAFRASTLVTAGRQLVLKLPPETSIGQADFDATIAYCSEAVWGRGLRNVDLERNDADLVGFWRHVRGAEDSQLCAAADGSFGQ